jgi:hypothetical protein
MMLGIHNTGIHLMSDMPIMLQYFGQVNQIQQEEYIIIGKMFIELSVTFVIMTGENQDSQVSCPYCQSKFKDSAELSKHIDGVHTGLGLLEGDARKY